MAIKGMLSKNLQEEFTSILGYAVVSYILILVVSYLQTYLPYGLLALDFNLMPLTIIKDWLIIAAIVFVSAMAVEYAEHGAGIDIDKWSKTEQYTAALIALLFYPVLFAFGYLSGALIPISFTMQGIQTVVLGFLITTAIYVITGIIALALAVRIK